MTTKRTNQRRGASKKRKPVMIADLAFEHRDNGEWGPELVHVFVPHETPSAVNARECGIDPSILLTLFIDPNHDVNETQTVTATITRNETVLALSDGITTERGTVHELVQRDPKVLSDVVICALLDFAGDYTSVFCAAMHHSIARNATALRVRDKEQAQRFQSLAAQEDA